MVRRAGIFLLLMLTGCAVKPPGPVQSQKAIHALLNDWHHAAAVADADAFFGAMTGDAVYLGTDKTEHWSKKEFEKWSRPFFERGKAWAFTPHDRHLYFAPDGKTAWFDELLDTWMGTCRGSGVVVLTRDGWKIAHYNLALTVDNDKMNEVIRVTGDHRTED